MFTDSQYKFYDYDYVKITLESQALFTHDEF